jgi:acetate kinase
LSYAYIARQLDSIGLNNKKVIVCHLGSGASLCAMNNGVSVATSMGYSPLSGVSMGTRPGELDADIPLVWQSEYGMSLAEVRDELYKKSGLLGVSGLSNDMRDLENSADPKAKMALDLFHYKVIGQIGELAAHLGGLDALIFTAGVGENGNLTRECILHQFGWLGFELDAAKNALRGVSPNQITTPNSLRSAYVIATDEEGEMAMQAAALLATQH